MPTTVTLAQARRLLVKFRVDPAVVSAKTLRDGMRVELEHGRRGGVRTNVTNNRLDDTARIALAHLEEFPDYYTHLERMEERLRRRRRVKRSIFLDQQP
jgi:Protein of unknown function (DUF5661)